MLVLIKNRRMRLPGNEQ